MFSLTRRVRLFPEERGQRTQRTLSKCLRSQESLNRHLALSGDNIVRTLEASGRSNREWDGHCVDAERTPQVKQKDEKQRKRTRSQLVDSTALWRAIDEL